MKNKKIETVFLHLGVIFTLFIWAIVGAFIIHKLNIFSDTSFSELFLLGFGFYIFLYIIGLLIVDDNYEIKIGRKKNE